MPTATVEFENGEPVYEAGAFRLKGLDLYKNWYRVVSFTQEDFDDLYAVLHARHLAQHYDATLMKRISNAVDKVKDDPLYGGEG